MANAIVALAKVIRSNYQLSSRVDDVYVKLMSTRLDGAEVFRHCKDLLKEKNDLACKVECAAELKKELNAIVTKSTKLIANLQARLRDS